MTLFVASLLLAALASVWVIGPILIRRFALLGDLIPGGVLDAEARKRVALASLKEVEYDRIAGKLDEADYQAQRTRLEREALRAIRGAEEAQGELPAIPLAHACGFVNPPTSRFCAGCGVSLG